MSARRDDLRAQESAWQQQQSRNADWQAWHKAHAAQEQRRWVQERDQRAAYVTGTGVAGPAVASSLRSPRPAPPAPSPLSCAPPSEPFLELECGPPTGASVIICGVTIQPDCVSSQGRRASRAPVGPTTAPVFGLASTQRAETATAQARIAQAKAAEADAAGAKAAAVQPHQPAVAQPRHASA
jgi:hypothetical protein